MLYRLDEGSCCQYRSTGNINLRNSYYREKEQNSLHLVSAWVSSHHLLLGQVKTEEKSNEITAIPKLLELINIKGHIVTIDAMGAQKKIAQQIVKQEGDYIFSRHRR
jgi:Transposase DDE domain